MNIVVCNWKTYVGGADEAAGLVSSYVVPSGVSAVVCPSSLHIPAVAGVARERRVGLGAQDISVSAEDAQTGRLSGVQLLGAGVSYVLVGHAETRAVGVTNAVVARKAVHALEAGLVPIVCLSEQGGGGEPGVEVSEQLEEILGAVRGHLQPSTELLVAYEPTAHIGAEHALAVEAIQAVAARLQRVLTRHALQQTPILYGGAVDADSAAGIVGCMDIDGLLVGRAGVDAGVINRIFTSV